MGDLTYRITTTTTSCVAYILPYIEQSSRVVVIAFCGPVIKTNNDGDSQNKSHSQLIGLFFLIERTDE